MIGLYHGKGKLNRKFNGRAKNINSHCSAYTTGHDQCTAFELSDLKL